MANHYHIAWNNVPVLTDRAADLYTRSMGNLSNAIQGVGNSGINFLQRMIDRRDLIDAKNKASNTQMILNKLAQADSLEDKQRMLAEGYGDLGAIRSMLGGGEFDERLVNANLNRWNTDINNRFMANENLKASTPEGRQALQDFAIAQMSNDPEKMAKASSNGNLDIRMTLAGGQLGQGMEATKYSRDYNKYVLDTNEAHLNEARQFANEQEKKAIEQKKKEIDNKAFADVLAGNEKTKEYHNLALKDLGAIFVDMGYTNNFADYLNDKASSNEEAQNRAKIFEQNFSNWLNKAPEFKDGVLNNLYNTLGASYKYHGLSEEEINKRFNDLSTALGVNFVPSTTKETTEETVDTANAKSVRDTINLYSGSTPKQTTLENRVENLPTEKNPVANTTEPVNTNISSNENQVLPTYNENYTEQDEKRYQALKAKNKEATDENIGKGLVRTEEEDAEFKKLEETRNALITNTNTGSTVSNEQLNNKANEGKIVVKNREGKEQEIDKETDSAINLDIALSTNGQKIEENPVIYEATNFEKLSEGLDKNSQIKSLDKAKTTYSGEAQTLGETLNLMTSPDANGNIMLDESSLSDKAKQQLKNIRKSLPYIRKTTSKQKTGKDEAKTLTAINNISKYVNMSQKLENLSDYTDQLERNQYNEISLKILGRSAGFKSLSNDDKYEAFQQVHSLQDFIINRNDSSKRSLFKNQNELDHITDLVAGNSVFKLNPTKLKSNLKNVLKNKIMDDVWRIPGGRDSQFNNAVEDFFAGCSSREEFQEKLKIFDAYLTHMGGGKSFDEYNDWGNLPSLIMGVKAINMLDVGSISLVDDMHKNTKNFYFPQSFLNDYFSAPEVVNVSTFINGNSLKQYNDPSYAYLVNLEKQNKAMTPKEFGINQFRSRKLRGQAFDIYDSVANQINKEDPYPNNNVASYTGSYNVNYVYGYPVYTQTQRPLTEPEKNKLDEKRKRNQERFNKRLKDIRYLEEQE